MKLKKIIVTSLASLMIVSATGSTFAATDIVDPHVSSQFEISTEEATEDKDKVLKDLSNAETITVDERSISEGVDLIAHTVDFLNVRKSASTGSAVVQKLSGGTPVKFDHTSAVISGGYRWVKLTHYKSSVTSGWVSTSGWIASNYFMDIYPSTTAIKTTTSNLNVRSKASTSSSIRRTLPSGTKVLVVPAAESGGWIPTWTSSSTLGGYCSTKYLR